MVASKPRIAVLIPAYNAEDTLKHAIASLNKDPEPHDIIVVDDCSRIPVESVLSPQPNLTVLRTSTNSGASAKPLNVGLEYILKQGYEFVARLDADDTVNPERLSVQRTYMDEHKDVLLAGSWGRVVSETGDLLFHLNYPVPYEDIVKACYYNCPFLHPSFIMRADALRKFGVYREDFPAAEDYEIARRFAAHGKIVNIPQYLINYTISTGGLTFSKRNAQMLSRLKIQWLYRDFTAPHFYLGIIQTLILWLLPIKVITAIKKHIKNYQKHPTRPGVATSC